jgi:hypothetical protein
MLSTGLNATEFNMIRVSSQPATPLADTDHTFMSELPETMCCPSGLKATEKTLFECPASDTSFLSDTNHIFTKLPLLPKTKCSVGTEGNRANISRVSNQALDTRILFIR